MTLKNDVALYDEDYFKKFDGWFHSPVKAHFYAGIILASGAKRVLDIGCGPNVLAKTLRKHGIDAIGADFSQHTGGADIIASCDDLPFDDGSFDLVVSTDLLEHLEEHQIHKTIQECKRLAPIQTHHICTDTDHDSSSDEYHVTLKPRHWWFEVFIAHGLTCTMEFMHFMNRLFVNPVEPYLGELTCRLWMFEVVK